MGFNFFFFFFNLTARMSACNSITKTKPFWDFYTLHSNVQRKENTQIHSCCPLKSGRTPVRRKPQIKPLLISLVRGSRALNYFIPSMTVTISATLLLSVEPNSEPQRGSPRVHSASESIPTTLRGHTAMSN